VRVGEHSLRKTEAVYLAKTIASMPWGEVPDQIQQLLRHRRLSKTVIALNRMLEDSPENRYLAKKALKKMGMWHSG
jgi:hypothetical protein